MITTQGQCYILALNTLERMAIQFVPDEIAPERTANYQDIVVVGRNNPHFHYIGGTDTLPLELDLFAMTEKRRDVLERVKWLRSLTFADGYKKPPQKIKVVFGELFQDEVWIVKSVKPRFSLFNKVYGFLPQQAYVSLELALDPESNLTLKDVKGTVTDGQIMTDNILKAYKWK